jgi:hypothetical protein
MQTQNRTNTTKVAAHPGVDCNSSKIIALVPTKQWHSHQAKATLKNKVTA